MACKIATDPAAVQSFAWPSIPSTRGRPSIQSSFSHSRTELPADRQHSVELDRARQAELAQCRQAAFDEGSKQGRESALKEIQNADDRLAQTLRDLVLLKRRIRAEAESDVVKLSLAIGRRILHRELSADPDSIQGIVYAGLQKLQNREISRVRVGPAAFDSVRIALEKAGVTPAISIVTDTKMRAGEIVFETSFGELDASVETQLQEIERGFADRLGLPC